MKRATAATGDRRRTVGAAGPPADALTEQLTAPEPAALPSAAEAEAELASQDLASASSPQWPGALPSF